MTDSVRKLFPSWCLEYHRYDLVDIVHHRYGYQWTGEVVRSTRVQGERCYMVRGDDGRERLVPAAWVMTADEERLIHSGRWVDDGSAVL